MRCIEAFTSFVALNNQEPLAVGMPVTMFARDLHLWLRKDYLRTTITLEQVQRHLVQPEETEDQLQISQLRVTQDRLEPDKSITPLGRVDPKGKTPKTPLSNPKKRRLVKASKGEPKKTKLMASAISAAKTVKVYPLPLLGGMNTFSFFFKLLCFLLLQAVVQNAPTPASRPMDLEVYGSSEQSEDEEAIPPATVEVQSEVPENNRL